MKLHMLAIINTMYVRPYSCIKEEVHVQFIFQKLSSRNLSSLLFKYKSKDFQGQNLLCKMLCICMKYAQNFPKKTYSWDLNGYSPNLQALIFFKCTIPSRSYPNIVIFFFLIFYTLTSIEVSVECCTTSAICCSVMQN